MATEMKVKLSNLKVDNTIEGNVLNDSNGNNIAETYLKQQQNITIIDRQDGKSGIIKSINNSSGIYFYGSNSNTDYYNGASLSLRNKDNDNKQFKRLKKIIIISI